MLSELHSFDTDYSAKEFVRSRVDVPISESIEVLGEGMALHSYTEELDDGMFTNVYDLSFDTTIVRPNIEVFSQLTSVYDRVNDHSDIRAAASGGFFYLVDSASGIPRQLGLNLALQDGHLRGLPVVDREAVLICGERLSAGYIRAMGTLSVDGAELSWSGSLTGHMTEAKVFGNGNSIITHAHDDETGSIRVLDENSRYTPAIDDDDMVDVGYLRREDGAFIGIDSSANGHLDVFAHDVVVRLHKRHVHAGLPEMHVLTLDEKVIDGTLRGALTVGPLLNTQDFTEHPINKDLSLGGKPPFLNIRLARTVLYGTDDNKVHIQLFDGRPGSKVFPGVTPQEAARLVGQNENITWGCFLDPGQTAKLVARGDEETKSLGNTHYLKWPSAPGEKYIWVPRTGRPVASMITLR